MPPSSPGAVRAEAEVGGATLTWSAPAETGSSALTGYQVEGEPREASQNIVLEGTTARITGLRAGGTYRFSVVARNEAGGGPASVSEAITLPDVPGAPEGITAARGNRQAAVTWTAPTNDGGRPVLGYLVTTRPQGTQVRVEATARSAVVSGLTNGVASTCTVRALNAVGEGPESHPSASVMPATVPSVPGVLSVTRGLRELTATWREPADTGGLPIEEYAVRVEPGGLVLRADASARSITVTGLSHGTEYTLRVVARNAEGEGLAASTPQRTLEVPGAPQGVTAAPGNQQVTVSWTAPTSDGGAPVLGYLVTARPQGTQVRVEATERSAVVTGLTNGVASTWTVLALNVVGEGPESRPSASVVPARVPSVPRAVRVQDEVGGATLTWSAPAEDGGSALTGYQVESTPREASQNIEIQGTTARITGLRAGVTYSLSVGARNAVGVGPASVPVAIIPPEVPGAPQVLTVTRGNRQVEVVWTAPASDGGRPVLGYVVTAQPQGTQVRVGATARSAVVSGLTNGVASTWTVRALNAVGEGPESPPSASVVPATVPSAPGAVAAGSGRGALTVTWSEPADTGGLPVQEYRVTAEPGGFGVRAGASARSATVTGLRSNTEYTLRVVARNDVGVGPDASTTQRTLEGPPSEPRGVKVARAVRALRVSWEPPAEAGGKPITGYTVTLQPTGQRVNVGADAREVAVADLPSSQAYTFTVAALNVLGTGLAASASPVRPLPAPAQVPAVTLPASPGGCVSITYSLGQEDGERADVLVEVDAQGHGTFRPATQAGSTDHEGTLARATSPTGTEHRFLWNRTQDVRGAATVQVRVSARVAGATAGSRTVAVSLPAASQSCELSLEGALVSALPEPFFSIQARAATAGDFDQDGKQDLVVQFDSSGMLLLKGLGNGHFLPGQQLELGILQRVYLQPVATDVDGDGVMDLLWMEGSGVLGVARGLGGGTFAPSQRYPTAAGVLLAADKPGLIVADFNGDGRPDVATGSARGPGFFLNQGSGTFGAFQPWNVSSANMLAADLDADGRQDLLLLRQGFPGAVLLSNGDGTFRSRPTDLFVEPVLGDVDQDGRVDALYVENKEVFLRRGDGLGGFAAAVRVAMTQGGHPNYDLPGGSSTAGDFDGDGLLDLALVTNVSGSRLSQLAVLLKGRGDGSFAPEVGLPVPRISSFITWGDFNGDTIADLVALPSASQWTGYGEWRLRDVRVWPGGPDRMARSTPTGPRGVIGTGDLNGDGWADVISAGRESDDLPPAASVVTLRWGGPGGLSAPQTVLDLSNEYVFVQGIDLVRVDAGTSLDVVLHGNDRTIFLLNEGSGTFRRVAGPQLGYTSHVEFGDVNKDGKPDLVNTSSSGSPSPQVQLRLGVGDGTFGPAVALGDASSYGSAALADLNRDGSLDVIMLQGGVPGIAAKVLLGQGDGAFTPGPALALAGPRYGQALHVADMDQDGIPDVVYCGYVSTDVYGLYVLRGTGDGSFTLASSTQTASVCVLHVVDLDGDGWRDVLAGRWLTDSISLWSGRPQGQLGPERIFGTYLHDPGGGPQSLTSVDANGDGRLDVLSGMGGRVTTLLLQR